MIRGIAIEASLNFGLAQSTGIIRGTEGVVHKISVMARKACRYITGEAVLIDGAVFACTCVEIVPSFAACAGCDCAFATGL
jgi:hypothetical protein